MERWYVVYIKENSEKKVGAQLTRRKIPYFLPSESVFHNAKLKMEFSDFKHLCFVNIKEEHLGILKSIPSVSNIIYWLNKPVVLDELEINIIQHFFDISDFQSIERIPINKYEPISILNLSSDQTVSFKNSKSEIKLNLPSLGYSIVGVIAFQNAVFTTNGNIAV